MSDFLNDVGNMPLILFAVDHDGVLTLSVGRGLDLLGWRSGDGVGRRIEELWHDRSDVQECVEAGLAGREILRRIEVLGRAYDLMITPTFDGGLIGLARDITEQREAEQQLELSQSKFRVAFRHTPDSVMLSAVPSGEILEVNHGFSLVTRYSREQAVGRTTLDLELWADVEQRREMFDLLRRDGKIEEQDVLIRRRSGEVRNCRLWGEILPLDEQPILLTVVRDVTEQLRSERERARVVAELEAKNQELELFSMTVAHDLKEPLIAIQGVAEAVLEDLAAGQLGDAMSDLRALARTAERMGQMVQSLLDLSRSGRAVETFSRLDMEEAVRDALEPLRNSFDGSVELEVDDGLGHAFGDRGRILQVLQNLIVNAVKFRRPGASVRVHIGRRPSESANCSVFFVADDGRGLALEDRERIFEPYGRLDSDVAGTGFGLALVKKIVEVHGGEVWAESDGPGTGATFCFSLPTSAEPT